MHTTALNLHACTLLFVFMAACIGRAQPDRSGPVSEPVSPDASASAHMGTPTTETVSSSETSANAPAAMSENPDPGKRVPGSDDTPEAVTTPPVPPRDPVDCSSSEPSGALSLSAEELSRRHGRDQTALAELSTSLRRPVEVCGIRGQHAFLLASVCADGSHPFARVTDILTAWKGSQGAGGRCGKLIDRYEVPCAEKRYQVFMDMYFCGGDEAFNGVQP